MGFKRGRMLIYMNFKGGTDETVFYDKKRDVLPSLAGWVENSIEIYMSRSVAQNSKYHQRSPVNSHHSQARGRLEDSYSVEWDGEITRPKD